MYHNYTDENLLTSSTNYLVIDSFSDSNSDSANNLIHNPENNFEKKYTNIIIKGSLLVTNFFIFLYKFTHKFVKKLLIICYCIFLIHFFSL